MCNVQPGYEHLVSVYAQKILWLSCDHTKYSCKYNVYVDASQSPLQLFLSRFVGEEDCVTRQGRLQLVSPY